MSKRRRHGNPAQSPRKRNEPPQSKDVNDEDKESVSAVVRQEIRRVFSFSGPLPPPEILEQYNKIEPGFANRICRMAESEAEHRRALENYAVKADYKEARLGQIFAFLIGVITIGCGAWVANSGNPAAGGILSTVGVVGLVSVFIYGRKHKGAEQSE